MAIIEAEHTAFDGALRWIVGHLALARAHSIEPAPGRFEQSLAFVATFMEKFHHPKEDEFLFKALRERTRDADEVLAILQREHAEIPEDFRQLQLALKGTHKGASSQFDDFAQLLERFARAQFEHMRLEGEGPLALAQRVLRPLDWEAIDVAFRANCDPLFGGGRSGLTGIMATLPSRPTLRAATNRR